MGDGYPGRDTPTQARSPNRRRSLRPCEIIARMDLRAQLIEARREEAQALLAAYQACLERVDRFIGIGGSLVTAAAAIGLARDFDQVMLGVPVALALMCTYVLQIYTDCIVLTAGREHLERQLAADMRGEALIYATRLAPLRQPDTAPSILGALVVYGLLLVGTGVAGAFVAVRLGEPALAIYAFAVVATFRLAGLALRDMTAARGRAPQAIRAGQPG
ncbi:MAG: hypothetical protein ACJ76L_02855 [Conexibacter sp.]